MEKRGFAAMKPQEQAEISAMGGRIAHERGKAHVFTSDEAKVAGVKGGKAVVKKLGREHMSEIGRKGAAARKASLARRAAEAKP